MANPRYNLFLAISFALLSTFGYGLNPPVTRFAHEYGVSVLTSCLLRSLAVFVVTGLVIVLARRSAFVPKSARKYIWMLGVTSTMVTLGYLSAVAFVPVPIATITFFTFPIVVLLVSPILEKSRISFARIAMAILAFIGLCAVIGPTFGALDWRGIVLAAMAAFGIAGSFFIGRRISDEVGPNTAGFWAHLISVPLILLAMLVFGDKGALSGMFAPFKDNPTAIIAVAAICLLYIMGFQFMMTSLRHGPASIVAPLFYIEPIITITASWALLGQTLKPVQMIGCAIVFTALIGCVWISRAPHKG